MGTPKAHEIAERFLRQRLIVRDFTEQLTASGDWRRLKERPVQKIGGDLGMAIDIDSAGDGWVRCPDRDRTIGYTAGMACAEDALPEPIAQALKRLDEYLEKGGDPEGELPATVTALLRPYRRQAIPA